MNRSTTEIVPYGLALSGGGARGFAHAGVIKALAEHGIVPDVVAGVSSGAVVAVLYAAGVDPDDMIKVFAGKAFTDLCEITIPKDGFFKLDGFKRLLRKYVPYKNIEDLPVRVSICATDFDRCCNKAFTEGPIMERLIASCSVPIIFKPVKIEGTYYVDGGVLRNLPAWAIRRECRHLIGVNCSPFSNYKYKLNIVEIAQRSYMLQAKLNAVDDMKMCDTLIITNSATSFSTFDTKKHAEIVAAGYSDACNVLDNPSESKNSIIHDFLLSNK